MIKILKEYGWVMFLGCSLSLLNAGANTWKYWAIMLPMIVLVNIKSNK